MKTIKVSIAGLGVVGSGLLSLLDQNQRFTRQGITFEVVGVSARTRHRERPVDISTYSWFDDPVEMANDPAADIFVELIGGADGPAKSAVIAALEAGKHVVTANKALIAEHGAQLAALAEQKGVSLKFEAAVAGGTPVVSGLRDGVAACHVTAVSGILNGTCNYILSTMAEKGADFDDVLLEAQKAGFAEADPSFDIDGVDAAHKLVILASLAFDAAVSMQNTSIGGIRHITLEDVRAARRLGMSIKLLGEAKMQEERVGLRVTPALIPQADPFAKASGSQNVVTVDANPLGRLAFQGPGAGAGATAAAVAADLGLIARNIKGPTYGVAAEDLRDLPILPVEDFENSYFIRLNLQDEPGALAAVAEALAAARVSIESLYQPPGDEGQASVEIVTHICKAAAAQNAAGALEKQPFVLGRPTVLPIILP